MNSSLRPEDFFRPTSAIRDNHRNLFAGRIKELEKLLKSLDIPGTLPVVYGPRGVGKSSVAWQVYSFASGNKDAHRAFHSIPLYHTHDDKIYLWLECERRFHSFQNSVLQLLLPTGLKHGKSLADAVPQVFSENEIKHLKSTFEMKVPIFSAKTEIGTQNSKRQKQLADASDGLDADPISLLSHFGARAIKETSKREIVIFVDEFDRLDDVSGLADVAKHMRNIRIVLVGVAESAKELVKDHPSIDRKIRKVKVTPLSKSEIEQIFSNAERVAEGASGFGTLIFDEAFRENAVQDSGGFPNIAQYLGLLALTETDAFRKIASGSNFRLGSEEYNKAVLSFVDFETGDDGDENDELIVPDEIRSAVGNSTKRAAIVKAASRLPANWFKISELKSLLKAKDLDDFDGNVQRLLSSGIIEKSDRLLRFTSPAHRTAVRIAEKYSLL